MQERVKARQAVFDENKFIEEQVSTQQPSNEEKVYQEPSQAEQIVEKRIVGNESLYRAKWAGFDRQF